MSYLLPFEHLKRKETLSLILHDEKLLVFIKIINIAIYLPHFLNLSITPNSKHGQMDDNVWRWIG